MSRREKYLQAILDQIRELAKCGLRTKVLFSYDRPSPQVALTLEGIRNYRRSWFRGVDLRCYSRPAPGPILSAGGERWMQVLQHQYTKLLELAPATQVCMLWDDDMLFSPAALSELKRLVRCPPDRVEAESLFMWDTYSQYNASFPKHWSAVLFRVYPGDQYPTDYVVHCPESVARSDFCVRLEAPVLNYGYLTDVDRAMAWGAQKDAGKIDAHTLCLVKEPVLEHVPANYVILPRRKSTRTVETF